VPNIKLPGMSWPKDNENKPEGTPPSSTTADSVKSSTDPKNTGKPPKNR